MLCPTCNKPSIEGTFYECENDHAWWAPNPGPQMRFLECNAHEILYGGAAGGGKSAALVMAPLRWVGHPFFKGLLLRRETSQLEELIDLARVWYPRIDPGAHGAFKGGSYHWQFSSGAKIQLNHCKDPKDAFNYTGKQYQWIGFDEVTHFLWEQYQEIKSRCRAAHQGLPRHLRSTSNPGGDGHEWVFRRWGPWLNPKFIEENGDCGLERRLASDGETDLPPLLSGQVVYVEKVGESERFYLAKPANYDPKLHNTRTFIGAKVTDNAVLMANDPGYVRNLADLDPVRRAQLETGDWLIKPAKGLYFKRAWWKTFDVAPAQGIRVRYWDRAASEDPTSDWTVGVRMIRVGDTYWIDDVVRIQASPGEVEATILMTAELDGKGTMQCLELDPGQAGKAEAFQYSKLLAGFDVRFPRPTGDKVTRASTLSAQVYAGNVHLMIKRPWTEQFIQELEGFPEDKHDDCVDAASGAFNILLILGGGSNKAAGVRKMTPPDPQSTSIG